MPARGTKPTQIRLTEGDKSWIEVLKREYGLETTAQVIRFAIRAVATWPPKHLEKYRAKTLDV